MAQQSFKHHYIPTFYLSRWAGPDGRICEFSRPYREVKPKRKFAEAAGWKKHLYTVTGLEPERQGIIEDRFFKETDQTANDALQFMLGNQDGTAEMPPRLRSGWSRFIASIRHRNPEGIALLRQKCRTWVEENLAEIRARYDGHREPSDPPTFAELRANIEHDIEHQTWAVLLQDVINSKTVGTFVNAMRWSVVSVPQNGHPLLTSDRPLHMTNGIDHPEGQIVLPIGRHQVFVAVNTREMEDTLRRRPPIEFVQALNDRTARNAQTYVYGSDDGQLRFVENRLRRASHS